MSIYYIITPFIVNIFWCVAVHEFDGSSPAPLVERLSSVEHLTLHQVILRHNPPLCDYADAE